METKKSDLGPNKSDLSAEMTRKKEIKDLHEVEASDGVGSDRGEQTGGPGGSNIAERTEAGKRNIYHDPGYWDKRYEKTEGTFDWYTDYRSLKPYLEELVDEDSRILNIGCGNSNLPRDLALDGYGDVTSIDISKLCINRMKKRSSEAKESSVQSLKWVQMDASRLSFSEYSFDLVIDKGTLDALVCSNDMLPTIRKIISEAWRVLRTGGCLVVITYGSPNTRMPFFQQKGEGGHPLWSVKAIRVPYSPSALLIRRIRAMLKGKPLRTATREMFAKAMPEVSKA
ncbi:hypothetical protein AAMO2058_001156400 [Amorphochlora amoebiformis]